MSKVTLPRTNQIGTNEWADVESNDAALAEVINGKLDNENIAAGANIARSKLEGGAQGIAGQWYAPTIIATEQTRESTSFGTLSTADEITGVVLPSGGLIRIGYIANVKNSISNAGRVAIYLNSNQVGSILAESEVPWSLTANTFTNLSTVSDGRVIMALGSYGGVIGTTGGYLGGMLEVFAGAGTYNVAVKFRSTSGSVTVKERKLWCEVHGS